MKRAALDDCINYLEKQDIIKAIQEKDISKLQEIARYQSTLLSIIEYSIKEIIWKETQDYK